MTQRPSPSLQARLPLAGISLNDPEQKLGIKSYTIQSDYTVSCDAFSLSVASEDPRQLYGLECQPIDITINGNPVLAGRIDVSRIADNVTAEYEGRDFMADLVECNVDPSLKMNSGFTIGDAIVLAAGPVGIASAVGEEEAVLRNIKTGASLGQPARPSALAEKLEKNKPEPGKGIYQYLNQICVRLGCTMQPNPADRTMIVVSEPDYDQAPAYVIRRSLDPANSSTNNILTASCTRDLSRFPSHCLITAKGTPAKKNQFGKVVAKAKPGVYVAEDFNPTVFKDQADIENLVVKGRRKPGDTSPLNGKLYRLYYQRDDKSKNVSQLENKKDRVFADRNKESIQYTATVQGHTSTSGALYANNTIVAVRDELTQVFEDLWVAGVTYKYDEGGGATTELRCWRKKTFQIGAK